MDSLYILIPVLIAAFVIFAFFNKMAIKGLDKAFYKKKWTEIENISSNGDMGKRLALIEADKLLDHALKARNYSGNTMGERLKSANSSLVNKNNIWSAHKLRNMLVHEQDVKLGAKRAKTALAAFKKELKNMGAL